MTSFTPSPMDRFGRMAENNSSGGEGGSTSRDGENSGDEGAGDEGAVDYVVEKILNKRCFPDSVRYLVKWEGYDSRYNSWEPEDSFNSRELIEEFEEEFRKKMSDLAKRKRPNRTLLYQKRREEKMRQEHTSRSPRTLPDQKHKRPSLPSKTPTASTSSPRPSTTESTTSSNGGAAAADDSSSGEEDEHGFKRGLEPESIIGAGKIDGQPSFLIKWKGNHPTEFIPTHIVYDYSPRLACNFYESKIVWVD